MITMEKREPQTLEELRKRKAEINDEVSILLREYYALSKRLRRMKQKENPTY